MDEMAGKAGGKGRPTPKRSQARRRGRGPVSRPPADRKEAARRRREAAAAARVEARRALREGDESRYPPLHAGPERRLVRDVVDARSGIGRVVVPAWAALLALSFLPVPAVRSASTLGLLALLGLVAGDAIATARLVRRRLGEEFPEGTAVPTRRLVRYGLARNMSMRRLRTPPPRA